MIKLIRFARGVVTHSGVVFEICDIPSSELIELNNLIDGTIELIACHENA